MRFQAELNAAAIAAGLVIGLLIGLAVATPNLIATVGVDDAPSIDLLVFNSTDPITRPDKNFNRQLP